MQSAVLRILDANLNRAREALRVLEDYARFALNDQDLSLQLKQLRHELASATGPIQAQALIFRDTPGDVGTVNKTPTEADRASLQSVVAAAGKRLGEALRTIEECLKIGFPAAAAKVESARYAFYALEQRLALTFTPGRERFSQVRLYVLITESACRLPWKHVLAEALAGGADCIQLREKELKSGELLSRALWVAQACREAGAISIINDRPDIALLSGADGVHLGQGDLPVAQARKIVGMQSLIGVSTHAPAQAQAAVTEGADYLGVGPVFPSSTKPRDILPGLDYARFAATLDIPAVAIAGITESNAPQVVGCGIRALAVTAAVTASADPRAAARALRRICDPRGGR